MKRRIKGRVKALGGIEILLLPALDLALTSLSYFSRMLAKGLMQRLRYMMQDPEPLTKYKDQKRS